MLKLINSKLKQSILLLFILFGNYTFSITLSTVKELQELKNYNELKNIEVEQIVKRIMERKDSVPELKRIGNTVYYTNEKIPYTGALIAKRNKKISGIYFYRNGKLEGDGFDYYGDGKIRCRMRAKNDIDIFNECYNKNGSKMHTFIGDGKLTGTLTGYYEGTDKKSYISEVTQKFDNQNGEMKYTRNGKTTVYERNGNILVELNFNNGSLLGERQKLYKNGKLKYDFIGGTKDIKGLKAMRSYIEYYDNSDIMKYSCDEVSKDNWKCKEYSKDGSFKQNVDGRKYVSVNNNHHGNIWINIFLGAWNILNP